jgi:ribosomal protein S4
MEAVKDVLKEEIIQCPREENLQKEKPHPSLENLLAEGHEVCQRRMLKGHTLDLVKAKNTMKKSSKLLAHSPKRNIRGQKTSKKLLGLIRFDRHKRIRKSICSTKTKTEWADSRPSFCRHRRHYILKEKHVQDTSQGQSSYQLVPGEKGPNGTRGGGVTGGDTLSQGVRGSKKKYRTGSYLFNVVCKFPRKYGYHFLGKEIMRTYYTIPSKLSMTRFIAGKVLKEHYKNLSTSTLESLAKSVRAQKAKVPGGAAPLRNANQVAKKFIIGLEQRLDSSLLRLLEFKPTCTTKQASAKKRNELQTSKKFLYKRPKFSQYIVKLPLASFGAFHAKQIINHGHIKINGKKVKSSGTRINWSDDHLEYRDPSICAQNLGDQRSTESTMLLRRFLLQDQNLQKDLEDAGQRQIPATVNYVRALKVKRFTEIFYMTYRNLH